MREATRLELAAYLAEHGHQLTMRPDYVDDPESEELTAPGCTWCEMEAATMDVDGKPVCSAFCAREEADHTRTVRRW